MTDFEIEMAGKLSAIEFVLEVLLANELALQPEDASHSFKADLKKKEGYITKGPISADILQAIKAATSKSIENLVNKVSEREEEIRRLRR